MSLRFQCVQSLEKILTEKIFFKSLKSEFKPQDSAFANNLILTALRRKASIDKLIATMLSKKIPNKNKILHNVLLLGATEILYLSTPDYAAINEYVNIAKKLTDRFSSNMVNAILRKVVSFKDEMKNKACFPENFVKILKKDYTPNQIKKMEEMLLYEAPIDITLKDKNVSLNGILFENGTLRLAPIHTNVESLNGYEDGAWWVQDLAASLPVCLLGDVGGKKVLDLCAAPGGKTAQLLLKGALVTAVDINSERMETLKENMQRLHLEQNLKVVVSDGLLFLENTKDLFDLILIDAPCSATGTFRKHPEVLYIKTVDDVQKMISLQQKLLEEASKRLTKKGKMVYCTCSIAQDEGERQIEKFLSIHKNFEPGGFDFSNLNIMGAKKLDTHLLDKQVLRTLPYDMKEDGGMDSFFAVCLGHK